MSDRIEIKDAGIENDQLVDLINKHHKERIAAINEDYKRNLGLFFLFVFLFISLNVGSVWIANQLPPLPIAQLSFIENIQTVGETQLCPNDTLRYNYHLRVTGRGVLRFDSSVMHTEFPNIISHDLSHRIIVDSSLNTFIQSNWTIPETAVGLESLQDVEWVPGTYRKSISISNINTNTPPAVGQIEFSLREDCFSG